MDGMNDKLDALFAEYRQAMPDVDAGANFMPGLWKQIEARRTANLSVFRRLSQAVALATLAVAILIAGVVIPHMQSSQVISASGASYVDVLAADHANDYREVFTLQQGR